MVSKYLDSFVNSFGSAAPEARLWVCVIEQAIGDLKHKRKEVRDDAADFFFDIEDDRLSNLMNILGLDGEVAKSVMKVMIQ